MDFVNRACILNSKYVVKGNDVSDMNETSKAWLTASKQIDS